MWSSAPAAQMCSKRLPPWYAGTLVFPNLFGSAYDVRTLTLFTGLGVSHDHILYIGIAALAPLGFAIYSLRHRGLTAPAHRRVAFLVVLATLSLLIMMAAPLYVPVTRFIPLLQVIRVAVRAGVLFLFAASALVALGTDSLLSVSGEALTRLNLYARRIALAAFIFVAAAIAASYLFRLAGVAVDAGERGKLRSPKEPRPRCQPVSAADAGIVIPLRSSSHGLVLAWRASGRLSRTGLFAALVSLLLIDLFWIRGQFNRTFDRSRVFPPTATPTSFNPFPPGAF